MFSSRKENPGSGPLASQGNTQAQVEFSELVKVLERDGYGISSSCLDYTWDRMVVAGMADSDRVIYEREFLRFQRGFAIDAIASMMSDACREPCWWHSSKNALEAVLTIRRMIDDLGLTPEEIGNSSSSIFKRFAEPMRHYWYTCLISDVIPFSASDSEGLSAPDGMRLIQPPLDLTKRWWPYECYWANYKTPPGSRCTIKD